MWVGAPSRGRLSELVSIVSQTVRLATARGDCPSLFQVYLGPFAWRRHGLPLISKPVFPPCRCGCPQELAVQFLFVKVANTRLAPAHPYLSPLSLFCSLFFFQLQRSKSTVVGKPILTSVCASFGRLVLCACVCFSIRRKKILRIPDTRLTFQIQGGRVLVLQAPSSSSGLLRPQISTESLEP